MKSLINLLFGCCFFCQISYGQYDYSLDSILGKRKFVSILKDDIQGAWTCIYSVYYDPGISPDEMPPYGLPIHAETLFFKEDSLFEFSYPCQYVSSCKYEIAADSLITTIDQKNYLIKFYNDTLVLYTKSRDILGESYTLQRFIRSNEKTNFVEFLKNKKVNSDCLLGEWKLVREVREPDGEDRTKIRYPFILPLKLNINIEYISSKMNKNNQLIIKVNGIKRAFNIFYIDDANLTLYTGKWRHGKIITVSYDRQED